MKRADLVKALRATADFEEKWRGPIAQHIFKDRDKRRAFKRVSNQITKEIRNKADRLEGGEDVTDLGGSVPKEEQHTETFYEFELPLESVDGRRVIFRDSPAPSIYIDREEWVALGAPLKVKVTVENAEESV